MKTSIYIKLFALIAILAVATAKDTKAPKATKSPKGTKSPKAGKAVTEEDFKNPDKIITVVAEPLPQEPPEWPPEMSRDEYEYEDEDEDEDGDGGAGQRSAAATSPAAGGPQHLPSEGRNEPWEAGAGHARGGSARRARTSLKLWSKSLRERANSLPQLRSPAARAQARSVLCPADALTLACPRRHHGTHVQRR